MPDLRNLGLQLAQLVAPYHEVPTKVQARGQNLPPTSGVAVGTSYLLGTSPQGVWAGRSLNIATLSATGWTFIPPVEGMSVWVHVEKAEVFFTGIAWEAVGSSGGAGSKAVLTRRNKQMPARTTVFDGDRACDIAVSVTPVAGSAFVVSVNGLPEPRLGDGTKTDACFLSNDGGYTARLISDIHAGDVLYWNGSVAGFQLSAATDLIEFTYEEAQE